MYLIRTNTMTIEIANALDRINLAIQLNLITLHNFLNGLPHITEPHIYPNSFDTSIGSILDSLQQGIIARIEGHSPSTVNNPSINLRPKVDLHDIIVLKHSVISGVRRVMRRHMIQRTARRKPNTSSQSIFPHQLSICLFNLLAQVGEFNTRLGDALRIFAYLAMHFTCMADLIVEILLHAFTCAQFGACGAEGVALQGMLLDFSDGEGAFCEEVAHGDGRWVGLAQGYVGVCEAVFAQ
mmetsp:Transcript_17319/g.25424  ORF Transcript_17319/g.25424 Transcript_17319/m.25424 type:complete len:239 (+) Transcript_17319:495-1211(+)